MYNLFVNSIQMQFEKQFMSCVISDFFNEPRKLGMKCWNEVS